MSGVFISHSSQDRLLVERLIYSVLKAHGIETFYSPEHIAIGELWGRVLDRALKSCEWFLLAMSPASAESENVIDEVYWAVKHLPPGRIVPVLLEKCDAEKLHLRLPRMEYIDLTRDVSDNIARLLAIFGVTRVDGAFVESAAVTTEETLPARFATAKSSSFVYSFPGESPEGRGKAPKLLCGIDSLSYGDPDTSFDPLEIADLLVRFPKAIMVQTDDDEPTGYVSAFPIAVDIAKRLYMKLLGDNYALPCTSHDPDRAIFLMSDVLTVPAAVAAPEVVWYFDSIAMVPAYDRPGPFGRHVDSDRASALLRKMNDQFRTWNSLFTITSLVTITVSKPGEYLLTGRGDVGKPSLRSLTRAGFGSFEKLWQDEERQYGCWLAKKAKGVMSTVTGR